MFISYTFSRLRIEAQEDVHDFSPFNTAHINHNYKHLAYGLYKHKVNIKYKLPQNPEEGDHQIASNGSTWLLQIPKNLTQVRHRKYTCYCTDTFTKYISKVNIFRIT